MIQYGLERNGKFLPRDALKRGNGVRLDTPDLWQDKARAFELAEKYGAVPIRYEVIKLGMHIDDILEQHIVKP